MTDIQIIGTDESLTHKTRGELYDVHFTLSAQPDQLWIDAFNESREFVRHSMWRHAKVAGRFIVVECALDEVARQLRDLKQDVETANEGRRARLRQRQRQAEDQAQRDEHERQKVRAALGSLKFEDG